jgi:hypothetical protein
MSKFIYNDSPLYTLLFRGGFLEIKPKSYIRATDADFNAGVFSNAQATGQVQFFDSLEEVPQAPPQPVFEVTSETTMVKGLTAEELKAELQAKEQVKSEVKDEFDDDAVAKIVAELKEEVIDELKLELKEEIKEEFREETKRGRKAKA